jgi:uncharacterized membrane protein
MLELLNDKHIKIYIVLITVFIISDLIFFGPWIETVGGSWGHILLLLIVPFEFCLFFLILLFVREVFKLFRKKKKKP